MDHLTQNDPAPEPLRSFIEEIRRSLTSEHSQPHKVSQVKHGLEEPLRQPSWLPEPWRCGDAQGYARHLLHSGIFFFIEMARRASAR